MTTLQEQFEKDFPREMRKLNINEKDYTNIKFTNRDLDLREYKNLTILSCHCNQLTSLSNLPSGLTELYCHYNQLTSLPQLPSSLTALLCYNNNIQLTDISIFSKLLKLTSLKIGTMEKGLKKSKHNQFYGSLKSYQNLTKLTSICIEATDVNEGLEYLPFSLAQSTRGGKKYHFIECSPHNTQAKCSQIQDQLRPFNYDLEAWQLAHPEKMLISRPEYFTNPDSKDKWLQALKNKIKKSQQALDYIIQNEPNKVAKIVRLETQIEILKEVVELERETHQDSMKAMDNFYQQNPPLEHLRLKNILQIFEKNI